MIRQTKTGKWQVECYDPAVKRKRYVGQRDGKRAAQDLERETILAWKRRGKPTKTFDGLSVREYATDWLDDHHGEGTRRPSPTTRQVNEMNLRKFLETFGDRALDGGIGRREALRWAKSRPHVAKSVAAMYNDALDDEECRSNPFANRRHEESRGRKDIHPITETELDRMGDIALAIWGDHYGSVCRAWIFFGAWVGTRPGETFGLTWPALDFAAGLVRVTRIKGRKQTERVVLPELAQHALRDMRQIPNRDGLLFPTVNGLRMRSGAWRYYFDPVRKALLAELDRDRREQLLAGRPDFDLYDLRHLCASVMADRGLNEHDIAAQLGNSPKECRETYIHSYVDRQRDRIRAVLDRPALVDLNAERARRIAE